MIIRSGKESLKVSCTGCMCHEMPMQFGNGDTCDECGCPKTEAAFHRMKSEEKQTVEGVIEDGKRRLAWDRYPDKK